MQTHKTFGFNDIGTAWNFVEYCEDEDPRTWGPDAVSSMPVRGRDGVYRVRAPAGCCEFTSLAGRRDVDVENALIARIDRRRRRARA